MKKFILPLLVLLFVGSIMAVESEPSAVVGYVKYDCVAGFNYTAIPMGSGGNAEDLVASHVPNISSIYKFVPATQGWESIEYDADFGEWAGSMPVVPGDVLLFASSQALSFYSLGEIPATYSYNISAGYNYVVVPVDRGDLTLAEDLGNEIGNVSSIYRWVNANQAWESIEYDSEFGEWAGSMPITIGDVLLISTSAATTWPAARGSIMMRQARK